MWYSREDKTKPVITAEEHANSSHGMQEVFTLPETAVLLYMGGLDYIKEKYEVELISERFPRFLDKCPVYKIKGNDEICFLDGGRGAPQAADTIETLNVFGVKNIISVGMIGGYSDLVEVGDIIIPPFAYSEEGVSRHYYEEIDAVRPDQELYEKAVAFVGNNKQYPIVTTDAIYRQTFYKEALWREKGAVGVDMETSALFSVGNYLGIKVTAILMVSDVHPLGEGEKRWTWKMSEEMRKDIIYKGIEFALCVNVG